MSCMIEWDKARRADFMVERWKKKAADIREKWTRISSLKSRDKSNLIMWKISSKFFPSIRPFFANDSHLSEPMTFRRWCQADLFIIHLCVVFFFISAWRIEMLKSRQAGAWKERIWEKLILILNWHSDWDFSIYEKNFSAREFNGEELKHEFSQPHFHSCPSAAAARLNFSIQPTIETEEFSLFELLFRDLEWMYGRRKYLTIERSKSAELERETMTAELCADKTNQNVLSPINVNINIRKISKSKFQTHIERQVAYLLTQARPHDSRQRTDTRRHAVGRLCRVLVWALRQVDSLIRRVHSSWSKLSTERDFQRLYHGGWENLGLVRRGWTWANLLVWSADTIPHIYAIMLEMYIGKATATVERCWMAAAAVAERECTLDFIYEWDVYLCIPMLLMNLSLRLFDHLKELLLR